jgi:hypothetical protein
MHGVLGPAIGKTIARVSAFRQIFVQGGLGRPNLLITHPRARMEAAKTQHFALRVQTREAIAARSGSALATVYRFMR